MPSLGNDLLKTYYILGYVKKDHATSQDRGSLRFYSPGNWETLIEKHTQSIPSPLVFSSLPLLAQSIG